MSEEKLYAVKNDEGKYWDFSDNDIFWSLAATRCPTTSGRNLATSTANEHGGHVVTFVEEPKKVVLSKTDALRQGWLVARYGRYNPDAVSDVLAKYKDEAWGMIDAYVNGYTVAKGKRYLLQMEGFGEHQGYSYMEDGIWYINTAPSQDYAVKHGYTVTKDEYDSAPNWVKILKPVEVTDDEK